MKTSQHCVKSVQSSNEDTRKTSIKSFWCLYCELWANFTHYFGISKVFAGQVDTFCTKSCIRKFSNILFKCKIYYLLHRNLCKKLLFVLYPYRTIKTYQKEKFAQHCNCYLYNILIICSHVSHTVGELILLCYTP